MPGYPNPDQDLKHNPHLCHKFNKEEPKSGLPLKPEPRKGMKSEKLKSKSKRLFRELDHGKVYTARIYYPTTKRVKNLSFTRIIITTKIDHEEDFTNNVKIRTMSFQLATKTENVG